VSSPIPRLFVVFLLIAWSFSATNTEVGHISSSQAPRHRPGYVGDQVCQECHKEKAASYFATAHHSTSRNPTSLSVLGDFRPKFNQLHSGSPVLHYEMTRKPSGFYESSVIQISPTQEIRQTERIDLAVGSGRRGQTYLFWKGDQLFELPVTYWTASKSWVNSPGYPDDVPRFDRPVVPRCLECHSSSFVVKGTVNEYQRDSLVLGIQCEVCHGPGREHAAMRRRHTSAAKENDAVIDIAALPRDRQLDLCALCHAGAGQSLAPALSFKPGDRLADDIAISDPANNAPDVHGNQVELLKMSKCWRSSEKLTCTTCHDVHKPQRNAASFSRVCLECHQTKSCGLYPKRGEALGRDCVDCHMPVQQSQKLVSYTNGHELRARVRNHRIGIYPAKGQ
jgi:Cytochrome c554 and c-prime